MGRWFPKKNRGLLVGIWSTTNNFGHIIGIQFSAGLMRAYTPHWGYLMETMAGILLFTAFVIYILLVSDPKYVNIDIAEL
jgi:MFS family permease